MNHRKNPYPTEGYRRKKIALTQKQIAEIVGLLSFYLDDGADGDLQGFIRKCKLCKTLARQGGLEYTIYDEIIEDEKQNWKDNHPDNFDSFGMRLNLNDTFKIR